MNTKAKIDLLERRLQVLTAREKENQGVCRRIRRDIRNLRKKAEQQKDSAFAAQKRTMTEIMEVIHGKDMEQKVCFTLYNKPADDGYILCFCPDFADLLSAEWDNRFKNRYCIDCNVSNYRIIQTICRIYSG